MTKKKFTIIRFIVLFLLFGLTYYWDFEQKERIITVILAGIILHGSEAIYWRYKEGQEKKEIL